MTDKLAKDLSNSELKAIFNAHKTVILTVAHSYDPKTNDDCILLILDQDAKNDISDIPATVGSDKMPVLIKYLPRPSYPR